MSWYVIDLRCDVTGDWWLAMGGQRTWCTSADLILAPGAGVRHRSARARSHARITCMCFSHPGLLALVPRSGKDEVWSSRSITELEATLQLAPCNWLHFRPRMPVETSQSTYVSCEAHLDLRMPRFMTAAISSLTAPSRRVCIAVAVQTCTLELSRAKQKFSLHCSRVVRRQIFHASGEFHSQVRRSGPAPKVCIVRVNKAASAHAYLSLAVMCQLRNISHRLPRQNPQNTAG